MAAFSDQELCNGIPIDHRLRQFLPSAKQKDSQGVGNHAEIVKGFGNTLVRDDGSRPSDNEAGFAGHLAKPGSTGGLVIALLQPAKTQVYIADFETVKDECPTLAYLEQTLKSIVGPRGFDTTSVFDAFPFITDSKSPETWTEESENAYNIFLAMLEAKKPEVLFACWRVKGRDEFKFSGKGVGRTDQVESVKLSSGHIVRVVNGFHPSFAANFYPSESCFRKLFMLELCKAFCELNSAWQEEKWMNSIRFRCRNRVHKLVEENNNDGEQQKTESGRVLRGSNPNESKRKYHAYKNSFEKGLQCLEKIFEHLVSPEYATQNLWDLYNFFLNQNISEGLCDFLLAVFEAMIRFEPNPSMPDSSSVELRHHISSKFRSFVKDFVPNLLRYPSGVQKSLWSDHFETSTSRGLKSSIEKSTIKFFEDIVDSIFELAKSWECYPDRVYDAIKEFTINFEGSLGQQLNSRRDRQDTQRQQTGVRYDTRNVDHLASKLNSISISSYPTAESVKLAGKTVSAKSLLNVIGSERSQPDQNYESSVKSTGPTTSPRHYSTSTSTCFYCREKGHWSRECPSPKKPSPKKQSKCYKCNEVGHFANECPR